LGRPKKSAKTLCIRSEKKYNGEIEVKRSPYICCMLCNKALSHGVNMAVKSEMGDD